MTGTYTGTIEESIFAKGSKSEQKTLVLATKSGDSYKLRLRGKNPYDTTPFESFLGQRVTITGRVRNGQLMINSIDDITVDPPQKGLPKPPTP